MSFFTQLFDTSDFPARWTCGEWTSFEGWLLIGSDLAIFGAYAAIPLSLAVYVAMKRRDIVFPTLYWLFAAFILSCGLTHLVDATIFWQPWYRLSGLLKFITAIVSWATAIVLIRSLPSALSLPGTIQLNTALEREIAVRRESEEEHQATSTRLQLALEHSQMGDWSWDAEDHSIHLSQRAASILSIEADDALRFDDILRRIDPADRKMVRHKTDKAVETGEEFEIECRLETQGDDPPTWISVLGRSTRSASDGSVRLIGVIQEITLRKGIEHEREQLLSLERIARVEAEKTNRLKDEFLTSLSHELRTPLNAILGWTHLLSDQPRPEDVSEGVAVIERNARQQAKLIEDLLDMNLIVSGQIRLDTAEVQLSELIASCLETVRWSAEKQGVAIEADLDPPPAPVIGDRDRLQQVLLNLLNNAIKFTPAGGRIVVGLRDVENEVELTVADNGAGIDPEFLPRIFERFRQADSSSTREYGGLGLGLAIARDFVEMHNGSIIAESDGLGLGATVRVRLPAATQLPAQTLDGIGNDESESPASNGSQPLLGKRILVVDDDGDTLTLMEHIFGRAGAQLSTAKRASIALALLERNSFDLVISDISMPAIDGYELIRLLRERDPEHGGNVPAIAFTAFARSDDQVRAMDAGFSAFLTKPVDPTELLATATRCLQSDPDGSMIQS